MGADAEPSASFGEEAPRRLPVPEVRDYHQINRRVTQWLDGGATHVVLEGVERQRLLLAGLRGEWSALVEIRGHSGPELAADLAAPHLIVVAHGAADDGAGRGLAAGTLVIRGACGACLAYRQSGGTVLAGGAAGPRAGLEMRGGRLIVLGPAGPLAGERQRGGEIWLPGASNAPPLAGRGHLGGTLLAGADHPAWARFREHGLEPLGGRCADTAGWLRAALAALGPT